VNNKIALVTGSSKGIGKAVALRLASEGYFTYVTYRTDRAGGEQVVQQIQAGGGSGTLLQLDVRSEESVQSTFKRLADKQGRLNVLVNNAGLEIPKDIEAASFDEWRAVTETQINGSFLCTKYALPLMKGAENANLIFITSSAGERPSPNFVAFCIGSAGKLAFARALATSLGKYGIRTNVVTPGETRTALWDTIGEEETIWQEYARKNPMGRVCTPEDVANAVMLLVSDSSHYLNGNTVYVNGGNHLK
jgi:NAD(P)-dependent dehydrogenase (short-subunit alcohol dehydrogenase family)